MNAWRIGPKHQVTGEPTDWLDTQADFYTSAARVAGYVGGYGSGKTIVLALAAWKALAANPGTKGALLAQTRNAIKTNLLPEFCAHLPPAHEGQAPIDRIRPASLSPALESVSLVDKWMRFHSGATVHWGAAEERTSWEGQNYGWVACDEVGLWSADAWRTLLGRVRVDCPRPMIRFASTPAMGWFFDYCQSTAAEIYHADTRENVYNAEGYVDGMLAGMSAQEARIYIEGQFLPRSGQVYASASAETWPSGNVVDHEYDPALPIYLGIDFGIRRPFAAFLQVLQDGRLCWFDEIVQSEITTEQIAGLIIEKGYQLAGVATDPAGKARSSATGEADIGILRQALRSIQPNVLIRASLPGPLREITAGVNVMRGLLCNAAGERKMVFSRDLTRRVYKGGRVGLWQSILGYRYPDGAKRDGVAKRDENPLKDGVHDHGVDAARYLMCTYFAPTTRIPGALKDKGSLSGGGGIDWANL